MVIQDNCNNNEHSGSDTKQNQEIPVEIPQLDPWGGIVSGIARFKARDDFSITLSATELMSSLAVISQTSEEAVPIFSSLRVTQMSIYSLVKTGYDPFEMSVSWTSRFREQEGLTDWRHSDSIWQGTFQPGDGSSWDRWFDLTMYDPDRRDYYSMRDRQKGLSVVPDFVDSDHTGRSESDDGFVSIVLHRGALLDIYYAAHLNYSGRFRRQKEHGYPQGGTIFRLGLDLQVPYLSKAPPSSAASPD